MRDASCCIVEVMNGGAGRRRVSRLRTESTAYSAPSRSAAIAPARSASEIWMRFSPLSERSAALNVMGFLFAASARLARLASIVQYSSGTNAWISRSRSTMRRSATDWTRPADSPRRTLFHSTGLRR